MAGGGIEFVKRLRELFMLLRGAEEWPFRVFSGDDLCVKEMYNDGEKN